MGNTGSEKHQGDIFTMLLAEVSSLSHKCTSYNVVELMVLFREHCF
jgi:hypothetical protein